MGSGIPWGSRIISTWITIIILRDHLATVRIEFFFFFFGFDGGDIFRLRNREEEELVQVSLRIEILPLYPFGVNDFE